MSFLKDYEKAKASGSSGSSGGKTIEQKRIDTELQKKYPGYTGIKNVLKKFTQDVDAGYIDSYINDINSYTMDVDWDNIGWGSAQQAYRNYAERIKDLRNRGGKILGYLDQNVSSLDPNSYHMLKDQIIASQNSLAEQMGALNKANHYYSQWDTEDAYNKAMQQRSWAQKYQGKSYQDLTPILETMEDGDEKNWLTDYAGAVDYDERINMDLNAANQEIQALQDQLTRFKNIEEMYNEYRGSPLLMLTQGDTFRDLESRYDSFNEKYGSIDKLQETIQKKRLRMAEAKQTQDSIQAEADLEEWKKTVRDSGTIQKDLDRLNATLAMTQDNIRNLNRGSSHQDLTMRSEADAQRQILEQQKAELERELQYSRMRDYAALMERSDFAEKSRYIPTGNGNVIRDNSTGMYVDTGFKDIEYDYINKNKKAQSYQGTMDSLSNLQRMGLDRSWLLQMTDDEVAVYNYLYQTEGKEAAGEYLDVMRGPLNQRQREAESLEWAEKAKKNPVLTSGFSVALAPLKAIGLMGQAADYLADGSIDQNAGYNRASYISTAIRNQVTEQIQQNEKWGKLGAFGYQTAMSMGDFLINGAAGGGFMGVPGITMAIMGSGAAADTVISAKDRGIEDKAAFGLGIVAGLAEALTERFSLEALLDADLLKNGIGVYMLKNSLTEGSEEAASSIINLFADIAASKEKSEWQEAISMYQDQGYSQEEAFSKAMADQAATMGMDFLGGVVSGGVMAGGTSAGYYADTKRTGRAMGRRGLTDAKQVQQILDAGANAEKGSTANLVAGQMQKKIDAGKALSQYEKGRLYQSNPQAVGEAVFGQGSVSLATPTTQGIDNQDERWQQAQRLASITGRDIRFYNGAENENGYYDKNTGEIYVNINGSDTVAQVVSHELTHSTELAESYADLAKFVRGKLRAEGRDWDQMKKNKADLYAAQGHALENDADIEAEIVAEYVQNHLLTNEQAIFEAVWDSPTLGQRILNWIDGILAKLNNQKAKERQMLNQARELYARALEESRSRNAGTAEQSRKAQVGTKSAGQQYAPEDLRYMDQMYRELYNRGEITEEEYDEYLAWREHETAAEEGQEELGRQYSFAGEKARTADLQKLTQAKQMESQGVSSETIRQQTGWFRGMDKKWRFEIDDSDFRVDRHGDTRGAVSYKWALEDLESARDELWGHADIETLNQVRAYNRARLAGDMEEKDRLYDMLIHGRHAYNFGMYAEMQDRVKDMSQRYNGVLHSGGHLADYVQHDALFEAYPHLQEATFRFGWLPDGTRGQYNSDSNTITISDEIADAPERTILHEIQHAIQEAESFSRGSSPEYWESRQKAGEHFGTNDRKIEEQMQHAQEILDSVPEEVADQFRDWYDLNNRDENAGIVRAQELADGEYGDQFDDYFMTTWSLEELQKYNYGRGINDLYQNTAGEIEARDTANRWKFGLDEEGRKNTPPDLGDERTVFAGNDGKGRQYSISNTYADEISEWDHEGRYSDASFTLGTTGDVLQGLGAIESDIYMQGDKINQILVDHPEMTLDEIKKIPQILEDPILILKSRNVGRGRSANTRMVMYGSVQAQNGAPVLTVLDLRPVENNLVIDDMQKVSSAYTKETNPTGYVSNSEVVYADKKRTAKLLRTIGFQMPIELQQSGYIGSITYDGQRVNISGTKFRDLVTENGAMPFKTGAQESGLPSGDAPSEISVQDQGPEVKDNDMAPPDEKQFSLVGAVTLNKRDVARDLRAILSRGGDPRELQRYVDGLEQTGRKAEQNGEKRYQTEEKRYQAGEKHNATAQEILEAAHSQGQNVEEYLRWNPEQFERDGRWRPEALEAMRMEQGGRKYSLSGETDGDESDNSIPEEQEESKARVIQRENLPTKAQSYLARAENKLLNSIGEVLSVPRYARYNSLKGIIQEISDVYLTDGTISDEKMSELFDKAYAEGIVADAAFYDQYKEIKDHLRTYGVTLSEQDRSDIADYDDFRKRAFGTLRILNEGGVPVDTAYQELRTMAPELFPDSITHPADQLERMYEVGQSIAISRKSLDEYYGPERDEFRKWAKNDFDAAVGDIFRDLRQVRRYAEEQATQEDVKKILTVEEAEEAFQELKRLRRNVDKVRAKNLMTESDEILLGRMMKGEIGPQHLNPTEDNVKGITALYEAKMAYESQVEVLAVYKRSVKAKRLQDADRYLETATGWKDKKAGILYARETMRRNIMDIVPDRKLAEEIAEHYFEAVHIAEAKSTKFKNDYRDRVRALNLSTKVIKGNLVSEAHAVQLLGEAMDNIRVMENARGRMGMRDGKTLAEWRAVVDDLWMNNTGLDRQKVERAVEEFRKIYDELFQQMNRIRVENGYEPVNYRQGYFPHFQPGGDGIMGFFGKVMGINTQVDALPTTINGLTHTFKPGIQWFGNAQERIGFNTAYDAVEGFDRYIEGVASVIFQTENIQKLRALATQARYRTSDEGIRKQVDAVRMDDRLTEEEKQREINAIYEHGRFALSNFVAELDEYTNLLANKKSKYDRTMESLIGRRAYTMMKAWENRVGANMIAGNLSSALTNFIPLTQAGAQLDAGMILKGMIDTLRNMKNGDNLVGMSDFLTNRRGSDTLVKTWMQKASGVMGTPMELIDNFTSETIVRAVYLQNRKRGMSEEEAMHQADIFAAGVMADRSKGAMPTMFESRNPLFKAFTQFQLEVNNQFSEVFKDLPRNHREKGLAMLALILLKYFLGAWMYNELFEKVIGRRSALDPIGILLEAGEDLTGYEIPNLFDMIDGERIEKTGEGSISEAVANLATNILGELPFAAGLTLFGVETDGGRLPAASAVPDLAALWEAATEEGWTGEQRWKQIQDELNKLAYVLPPFGGGQISKSWKGIKAYIEGGSYSLDKDGDKILQYPVYKDDPDDAFWSLVRAAFLGKNSLPEAQEWVKNGYDSLNQYETVVYHDLLNCGVKDRDAFDLVNQLRALEETETESGARRAQGRRILARSGISAEGKAVAFYGMVAAKTEREWMDKLVEAGAEQADTMAFVSNLYDADNLKGTEKKQEQLTVFLDAPLTEDEKKVAVGFIMDTELETEAGNPTQYAKFLSALETGLTVDKYMEIRATETDIEDYLELTDIGIKGDKSADLAISMATLEPMEGYDKVSWIQRCRTVMDADLNETQKIQALQTVDGLYESTYEKIVTGHNFGMNVNSYIDLKSIMPHFDENGNGNYTQAETESAINALAGDDNALYALTGTTPNGYTLTDREKAILWQLQDKRWKPYRNPFDREVGQMVYDYMTADDSAEAVTKAESGEYFDIAKLFSKVR